MDWMRSISDWVEGSACHLQVLYIDAEQGALVVKGAVPGKPGSFVEVTPNKVVGVNC
jgi:ribosomal protein L3